MSVTREVASAVSKGPVAALLKPAGFRRSALHFWREENGVNHAVNFQASAWGTRASGSFTINLGISTIALYEAFTGREFPTNRGTACWPISMRIGLLTLEHKDHWWDVNSIADARVIGEEAVVLLRQYGLPFFEGLRSPEQLATWVREAKPNYGVFPAQVPLILATLAVERGDVSEATSLLRAAAAASRGKPFESTIRRVASRLGVPLGA